MNISGKGINLGLSRSAKGLIVNADATNADLNIFRKYISKQDELIRKFRVVLAQPLRGEIS